MKGLRGALFHVALVGLPLAPLTGCGERAAPPAPELPIGTEEGTRPPPLEGTLASGEAFSIASTEGSPTMLVFYSTGSCGLCRVQLQQLQASLAGFRALGADLVGVTLDPPAVSQALAQQMALDFRLVSVDTAVFQEWQVLDAEHRSPLPATYVIDSNSVIHFRHIGRNAADRSTAADLLTILQRMSAS